MFPIYEVSAAPHLPQNFSMPQAITTRPEALVSVLVSVAEGATDVAITERNGEIYISIIAS